MTNVDPAESSTMTNTPKKRKQFPACSSGYSCTPPQAERAPEDALVDAAFDVVWLGSRPPCGCVVARVPA